MLSLALPVHYNPLVNEYRLQYLNISVFMFYWFIFFHDEKKGFFPIKKIDEQEKVNDGKDQIFSLTNLEVFLSDDFTSLSLFSRIF